MRRLVFLGVVLVVLAAVAGSALAGRASPSGNGMIVYVGEQDGVPGLFVVDPRTSASARMTTGDDHDPVWSPDGRRVAFERVVGSADPSSWSGPPRAIFVINADGGGLRQATDATSVDWSPDWSPDGKRIAFIRYGEGVCIVNIDATGLRRVTTWPEGVMSLSWSSTGMLAYDNAWLRDIWTVRPGSSLPRQITFDRRSLWPAWSPDGRRIAYVHGTTEAWFEIYVMGANGTRPVRLTDNRFDDREPAWSPDGKWIAYTEWVGQRMFVQMMNSDGTHPRRLVEGSSPDWQPIPR